MKLALLTAGLGFRKDTYTGGIGQKQSHKSDELSGPVAVISCSHTGSPSTDGEAHKAQSLLIGVWVDYHFLLVLLMTAG